MKYNQAQIDGSIIKAVTEMGFVEMTPIQEKAIPPLMEGRDVIGQAKTGTGKTAAFGIPLIEGIAPEAKHVQAIVLCPTRELALQVTDEIRKFTKYMAGIKLLAVYGGSDMSAQIRGLKGAQVVVGTPGRVMDHMRRRTLKLDGVQMVVLDEADEMLNMGFREDIETILNEIPKDRQTALFSATMPKEILEISKNYQQDALHIKTITQELTLSKVEQYFFQMKSVDKVAVLCRLLDFYGPKRSLVFCKTKRGADSLAGTMKAKGYSAEPLHGDLSQGQRNTAMAGFRHGGVSILVATDVAARGIDVDDVEVVFNFDIPMEEEQYVHRIGRTGRAGREGRAFTFVVGKEIYKLMSIEKYCKTKIEKGTLPSAVAVGRMKSEKILYQAFRVCKRHDLSGMKKLLRRKMAETDWTMEDIAAALLHMEMGEEIQEISGQEPEAAPMKKKGKKQGRRKGRR